MIAANKNKFSHCKIVCNITKLLISKHV